MIQELMHSATSTNLELKLIKNPTAPKAKKSKLHNIIPEKKGIERVQVLQQTRVSKETRSRSLCLVKSLQKSPQFKTPTTRT